MKVGLSLMKNGLISLAKNLLIQFANVAAALATNAAIQTRVHGSEMTALIISNKEMVYIMKIVKSLEKSSLLIKDVCETLKMQLKNKKMNFLWCY